MMELVDILDMSPLGRISRRGTSNLKWVGGILIGLFCDPKVGIAKFWVGVVFCMRAGRCREKTHPAAKRTKLGASKTKTGRNLWVISAHQGAVLLGEISNCTHTVGAGRF